jgi:DNA-binding NarL/FixJ family response regulator
MVPKAGGRDDNAHHDDAGKHCGSRSCSSDNGVAMTPCRVILADDDVLLREGMASLLERSDFKVIGQVGTGDHLVTMVRDDPPDLVVVDIRMPPTHTIEGLEAARVIRQEFPGTGILVLSAHV